MSIARSTGAFLGTDDDTGVSVAAAQVSAGNQVDLLGDATSLGDVFIYARWTPASGAQGNIRIKLYRNRTTGKTYALPQVLEAAVGAGKAFLGTFPASRYMQADFENRSTGAVTNAAILYELEKVS